MRSAKSVGRIIGLVSLVRILLAPPVYFVMMRPVLDPDFLADAAGSALRIKVALLLAFVLGALTLMIAIAAMPVFRRYSEGMALSFLLLSAVGCATLAMDNVAILNMLSLSQEYAKAGAAHELLQTLARLDRSAWRWAHFSNLVLAHVTVFLLTAILYRFALVPRALAVFGMAAAVLSTTAVAMPLLGYGFVSLMLIPTALGQLALTLWLIVRGFEERQQLLHGDAKRVELARA